MINRKIIGNILAAFAGVFIGRTRDTGIPNLIQHTPRFCNKCGKVLDRDGDASSISRGDICLECFIDETNND